MLQMLVSQIGVYWLWFLLFGSFGLFVANNGTRKSSWEFIQTLWSGVSYQRETEPVDEFFKGVLSNLLKSGFVDAFASIGPKYSKRRIEFTKYFREPGDFGIELRFSNKAWATNYFQQVRSYCETNNLPYKLQTGGTRY